MGTRADQNDSTTGEHISEIWTERADGVTIWSDAAGPIDGLPVVLLPPEQRSSAVFEEELVDELVAAGHRVIRIDLRDQGRSSWVDRDDHYGAADLCEDVRAVLDAWHVGAAVLVGVGLGGQVALRLALDHPMRAAALVLINTSAWPLNPAVDGPDEMTMASLTIRQAVDNAKDLQTTLSRHSVIWAGDGADTNARTEFAIVAGWLKHGHNPRSSHWRAVLEFDNELPRLGDLAVETLVIHGERDPLIRLAHGQHLAAAIANAQLRVVAGAGHSVRSIGNAELSSALVEFSGALSAKRSV